MAFEAEMRRRAAAVQEASTEEAEQARLEDVIRRAAERAFAEWWRGLGLKEEPPEATYYGFRHHSEYGTSGSSASSNGVRTYHYSEDRCEISLVIDGRRYHGSFTSNIAATDNGSKLSMTVEVRSRWFKANTAEEIGEALSKRKKK